MNDQDDCLKVFILAVLTNNLTLQSDNMIGDGEMEMGYLQAL
jgi:hypothetical protein